MRSTRLFRHVQHVFLVHREIHFDGSRIRDGCQWLHTLCANQRSHLVRQAANDAVSRTFHKAKAQHIFCRRQRGLCLRHGSARAFVGVLRRLQFVRTNNITFEKLFAVVESKLGGVKLHLSRIKCGLRLAHSCLVRGVVDDEEQLSCLNHLPFLHAEFGDKTRHFGPYLHILHTLDRGRISSLRLRTLRAYCHYGIFVVVHFHVASAATSSQQGNTGHQHEPFFLSHTLLSKTILFLISTNLLSQLENPTRMLSFYTAKVQRNIKPFQYTPPHLTIISTARTKGLASRHNMPMQHH